MVTEFCCPTCGGAHASAEACPLKRGSDNALTVAGRAKPPGRTPPSAAALPSLAHQEDGAPEIKIASNAVELAPGTRVGDYVVGEKLGEGGMGTVFAGVHPVIGKKVAIKLLNAGLSDDPLIVQRFVQEARAVNQIGHRNIVDIFAFGQLESGRHYCVMEFLQGCSLQRRLEMDPPLTYAEVLTILVEVLTALQAAHDAGIVHRDLKPDNLFLVEGKNGERSVKLLDFGIAKLTRRGDELGQTRTGVPLGTPRYMSPEQCRGRAVDARADLYAMGVIMFQVFTGRLPFRGPDYIDTVNGHLSGTAPLPSDFAEVPAAVEALIMQCLEKEPDRRPQRADGLREKLLAMSSEMGAQRVPRDPGVVLDTMSTPSLPRPGSTQAQVPAVKRTPAWAAKRAAKRRSRTGWLVGAVLVLVAIAGLGARRVRRAHAPQMAATPYQLWIMTDPPGATLVVDGRAQAAVTPTRLELEKPEAVIRVEKDGWRSRDELVRFTAEQHQRTLDWRLEALPAEIHARTNAGNASWILDGNPVGSGERLDVQAITPGHHTLRVEARGMRAHEETIALGAAERSTLVWPLQPSAPPTPKKRRATALSDSPNLDFKP